MVSDPELSEWLPSRRLELLAAAIGRRLVEVERLFLLDLPTFLNDKRFTATDFFSRNCGPVQLRFDGGLLHVLNVWPSQLSVVLLSDLMRESADERLYRLSESEACSVRMRSCLGRTCEEVRIWTLEQDFESEEAKEVAVSYVFSADTELFYCIYLHGDMDSDYLLMGDDVPRDQARKSVSLKPGGVVERG